MLRPCVLVFYVGVGFKKGSMRSIINKMKKIIMEGKKGPLGRRVQSRGYN